MSTSAESLAPPAAAAHPGTVGYSAFERGLRAKLFADMGRLRGGTLVIHDALGSNVLGTADGDEPLHMHVTVQSPEFYRQVAMNGSVGAGEAYMDGHWQCSDLVALVRLLVRNRDLLDGMEGGLARLGGVAMRVWNRFRRNTRDGSRRNIAAHYDLGNALFKLFLDDELMYSSAIFADPDESLGTGSLGAESLDRASRHKLDRICRKLDLKPSDRVIEIGTGWGGFAMHAAKHYGCHVTTTTISAEQHALTLERVAAAGLTGRVTVLKQDYRDLAGRYDKLVSIEMIEAIGHQYLDTYFAQCAALLKPDGLALVQAITIEDSRYEQALRSVDFIKRHVFPGSFIPCVSAMLGASARSSDLRLFGLEDIGPSYALTLRHWRQRFLSRLDEVRALGYDERFVRMWEYYLCYCEGGFIERSIGTVQMLFAKPGNRRPQFVPALDGGATCS
ncbi:MAG TPA: cyclopropane-fatty-acyl-phospholipid synthase family protein [Xanthomonadaceae bacterium]|jgi:cyclopropane-fatty-acyl-phospholipid synthase